VTRVLVMLGSLAASTAASAATACPPLPGADVVLSPGARIHVGEMHGTTEIPRTFGTLVCHATKKGGAVRVGLEIPASEDASIAAYLGSNGAPADRAALLASPWWANKRWQEGRRSVAWAALLETIRALRHGGADIDIATFDDESQKDRDQAMAKRAFAAIARAPKATWLLYSGNVHARKTPGTFPQPLMAGDLVKMGVPLVTLDARYGRGSAWVCFSMDGAGCGPSVVGHAGAPRPVGVTLHPSDDGAYDGVLDVGVVSFSPPAAVPPSPSQAARAAAIPRILAALDAYDAKDWPRCAGLYDALARELRVADHAYNAACCHALGGKPDSAFVALALAIDYGFHDDGSLAKDSDLVSLHGDARWKPLVARASAPRSPAK
jgi:hypothetical protein